MEKGHSDSDRSYLNTGDEGLCWVDITVGSITI